MVPFRRITETLLQTARQSGFARVDAAYFHNVPGAVLYRDLSLTASVPFEEVIAPFRDAGVLVISDSGAARGTFDRSRVMETDATLARLRIFTKNVA